MKSSLTLESLKKIFGVLQVNPSYFFNTETVQTQSSVIRGTNSNEYLTVNQFIYKDLSSNHLWLGFSPIILNPGENMGESIYPLRKRVSVCFGWQADRTNKPSRISFTRT